LKDIGNVKKDGQVRAIASGALTDGASVVINSDGTVSVISSSSGTQSLGTSVVYESANQTFYNAPVYDANAQKVVIGYADGGNANKGTAVVGTVSGTSITFGTPVVFEEGSPYYLSAVYEPNAQKVVFSYRDTGNSNAGTSIVGTVSGTTITFGTAAVYDSGGSYFNEMVYHPDAQKVVITYRDIGNSNYGTAVVGTVSGTSISFGTPTVFESADTRNMSLAYEPNEQKVVVAYEDSGSSGYGTAIVGTVSGTSISFGSAVVYESASTEDQRIVYDPDAQKVVIFYQDEGDGDKGVAIVGTVSGSSISFGTPVIFNTAATSFITATYNTVAKSITVTYQDGLSGERELVIGTVSGTSISFTSSLVVYSGSTDHARAVYDSNEKVVIIAYQDQGNSNYGTAIAFRTAYEDTNLTSENFIGFSDGAFADTDSAVINTANTIDRNQSSLTAGQTYFVQTDGTLGLTADDPSVTAGTAISSTDIIVKG
jgi:hypothetical protein